MKEFSLSRESSEETPKQEFSLTVEDAVALAIDAVRNFDPGLPAGAAHFFHEYPEVLHSALDDYVHTSPRLQRDAARRHAAEQMVNILKRGYPVDTPELVQEEVVTE